MKKRLLAVWTAATMPLGETQLATPKTSHTWRSPVSSQRPYTSTLHIEFDHRGVAEVTSEAITQILGDGGWTRLA